MRRILRILPLALIAFLLVVPVLSLAQHTNPDGNTNPDGSTGSGFQIENPLSCGNVAEEAFLCLVRQIISKLTLLGAPIAVLMVLIGAFQILTAGGSPEKVTTGRKTIMYAAIGYAIILVADGLTYIIQEILGASGAT